MATISLYSRPELLRSGNQALRPAQFQLADSGLASGLGQLAKVSAGFAADLNEKAKKADDATTLINLDRDISETNLQLSKWQMENSNNDQIMKDGVSLWEVKTRETYDNLMAKYTNMDMTPETRERVNTIINHHANNNIANSWAGGVKQIGNNFDTNFTSLLNNVEQNGDGIIARQSIQTAREGGVLNDVQANARLQAITTAENRFKLNGINTQAKSLIETAAFDPNNYDKAKSLYKTAFDSKLITEDEYNAQISNIDYKFQYNDKLNEFNVNLQKDPVSVDNALNRTSVIPAQTDYIEFIKNLEGFVPTSQWDYKQFSVGYGTRGKEGETLTKEQAAERLKSELTTHENRVDELAKKYNMSLNSNQRAALISYDFNTGKVEGVFERSGGNTQNIGSAIRNGIKTADGKVLQGLVNRRNAEADLADSATKAGISRGEYSWMSPVDYEKAKIASSAAVSKKASDAFQTLKNAIDLNQVLPDEFAVGTGATPLSKALENPNYSALNNSDNEDIKLMKKALIAYADNKSGKIMTNDGMEYEAMISRISSYDPTTDASGSRYAALGTMISSGFTDTYAKELQDRLDKQRETGIDFQFNKVGSDAINALNKRAFDEQMFGEFRKLNLVEVQDKDRKISEADIKANTLFDLPDPNNPGQTIRRVPTQADIAAGLKTGTKRYVIPVKPNAVSYLKYTGEDSAPELVELKKDQWEKVGVTQVYDEDVNAKATITEKVKSVRGILEKEIREGTIKNNEDALKRMNQLTSGFVKIPTVSNISTSVAKPIQKTTEAIASPSVKKNAALEILKRK